MIAFLKGAPYTLFIVGIILWHASAKSPEIFTIARYVQMTLDLNVYIMDFQDYLGYRSGVVVLMVTEIYHCHQNI